MQKEERHTVILEEIRTYNKVKSADLGDKLRVSEDTIRRDLKELADHGLIKKVHGGAMSTSLTPLNQTGQDVYAHEKKIAIVKKAVPLLQDGHIILIDGGTTNLELARLMPQEIHTHVFTNSLLVAMVLSEHPLAEVTLLGGKFSKKNKVTYGIDVINYLSEIRADLCFIGAKSLHPEVGITEKNREEAVTKREMMAAANEVISLVISEKLGKLQPFKISSINKLHTIVTELPADHERLLPYRSMGIRVI